MFVDYITTFTWFELAEEPETWETWILVLARLVIGPQLFHLSEPSYFLCKAEIITAHRVVVGIKVTFV